MTSPRSSLRARLADQDLGTLLVPGVGTPLEAHAAVAAGADTLYVSGYAVAAWRHGVPDVGLIAGEEIAAGLDAITTAVDATVICDADTGYGEVASVGRTVRRLEARGAAAIQLEDQAWPKRCGHLRGKTVVPVEEHARKIAAAVAARDSDDTLVIARTDALAPHGIDDAIARAHRYADAGADVLFVDAPDSVEAVERIGRELAGMPLMANVSESGLTPHLSVAEWQKFGFALVIYPTAALRVATHAVSAFYRDLLDAGDSRAWLDRMVTLDSLNELVGLSRLEQFEQQVTR